MTDVIAGAGAGILSARIGYWLLPHTRKWFKKRPKNNIVLATPFYGNGQGGVTCTVLLP